MFEKGHKNKRIHLLRLAVMAKSMVLGSKKQLSL